MENHVCINYMCCLQTKFHVKINGQGFENRTYNAVSGIGTHELLMNIISCHIFINNTKLAVILSCCIKLINYYLQECFVLHKKNPNDFKNVPLHVKHVPKMIS